MAVKQNDQLFQVTLCLPSPTRICLPGCRPDCKLMVWLLLCVSRFAKPTKVKESLSNEKAQKTTTLTDMVQDGCMKPFSLLNIDSRRDGAQAAREKHLTHVQDLLSREKEARVRLSVPAWKYTTTSRWNSHEHYKRVKTINKKDQEEIKRFPQRLPRISFMNITKICLGESAQLMRQHDLCLNWPPDISWLFISQCPFLSHCVPESPSRCTWSNPKRTECSWAALSLAWPVDHINIQLLHSLLC